MTDALFDVGSAVFSPCGRYRYRLTRDGIGGADRRHLTWIMLNPSRATATVDDHTIRKVRGYTRRAGFNGFVVVNLYAWMATYPEELAKVPAPCGPDNDAAILSAAETAAKVIVAWGAGSPLAAPRARAVEALLDGLPLWCLGFTKEGEPRHPSRPAYAVPLVPYNDEAARLAGVNPLA